MSAENGYLVVEDVAALLHCSVRTVQEQVSRRELPHRRVAGMRRILFKREELELFLDGAELETVDLPRGGRVVRPVVRESA